MLRHQNQKKKETKPKSAREALDMYDSESTGSSSRKYNAETLSAELGLCGKFLRYLVLIINFFFIAIGFVLLVYGAWYASVSSTASDLAGKDWTGFVIVLGIFVMIVGVIGLIGAKYQNRVILVFYFVVIIILFILTLACGAWVLTLEGKESSMLSSGWISAPDAVRRAAQLTYNCCGLSVFNDTYAAQPCPPGNMASSPPVEPADHPCLNELVGSVLKYYKSFGALLLIICFTLLGDVGLTWWLFKALNRLKARSTG